MLLPIAPSAPLLLQRPPCVKIIGPGLGISVMGWYSQCHHGKVRPSVLPDQSQRQVIGNQELGRLPDESAPWRLPKGDYE